MPKNSSLIADRSAISPLNKGLGLLTAPADPGSIAAQRWNLLREDISLPAAVLYQDRVQHNLRWMQQFISAYGLQLAPHGKTTMCPGLFQMQLEGGAWGITLATAQQTRVAYEHGVRRVLMANQLAGKANMAIIAELLQDPSFEYFCLVDSPELAEQSGAFFAHRGQRLNVLVELGVEGGRAGIRNDDQLTAVLEALARWKHSLALSGVEMYEGILDNEASIRAFLRRAVQVTRRLIGEERFERKPALLSGAGSAWYDIVAEEFSSAGFDPSVEIILRPGCYLTHDVGAYRAAQARILDANPVAKKMHSGLQPALQIWACVQSVPEAGKAIIAMGKRDVSFDAGFPVPALHFRPGDSGPRAAPEHWAITKLMDQHAYLGIHAYDDLRPGDMLAFDISHPCLTFDKWRALLVLNTEYQVVDVLSTWF